MKTLFTIVFAAVIVAGLSYAITSASAMPDVHFSYSTNECVKVINYTDEVFACESLPSKYNHVWVE